jgi:gluconate 2-dehydrogenase
MKEKILVTRAVFPEVLDALKQAFDVDDNQADMPLGDEALRSRAAGKAGLLVWGNRVDASVLDAAPTLRAVCNMMVGYNNLDIAACTQRGILATNTPGVLDDTTADQAWALLLAAARRVTESERWLRAGKWTGMPFSQMLGTDVHHATLGVLGMGRIGRAVARRARGFDMQVIYHNRTRLSPELERECNARYVSFDELLAQSDFLSVNLPYTPDSHHLIGAAELVRMKPTAIIVNTARGGIIDDAALIAALKSGALAAAGLDVFEGEPNFNRGFLELDNVALAPHLGSATRATRLAMANLAMANLKAALAGERPPCLINPEAWERRRPRP